MRFKQVSAFTAAAVGFAAFGGLSPFGTAPVHAQKMAGKRDAFPYAKLFVTPIPGYRKSALAQPQRVAFAYFKPRSGKVTANVTLFVQPASPGLTANLEAAECLGQSVKKHNPHYEPLGTGTLTVSGEKAAFITCAFTGGDGFRVKNKQVIVVHESKCYVFTFAASPAVFNKKVLNRHRCAIAYIPWCFFGAAF